MNGYNNRSRLADAELDDSELFNEGKKSLWKLNSVISVHVFVHNFIKHVLLPEEIIFVYVSFTSCTNINSFLLHVYIQIFIVKNWIKEKKYWILMYVSTQENEFRQDSWFLDF